MKKLIVTILVLICGISCKDLKKEQIEGIRRSFFSHNPDFITDTFVFYDIIIPVQYKNDKMYICTTMEYLFCQVGVEIIDFDTFWKSVYSIYKSGKSLPVSSDVYEDLKISSIKSDPVFASIYNQNGIEGVIDYFLGRKRLFENSAKDFFVYLCWQHDVFVVTVYRPETGVWVTYLSGNLPEKYGREVSVTQWRYK